VFQVALDSWRTGQALACLLNSHKFGDVIQLWLSKPGVNQYFSEKLIFGYVLNEKMQGI